MFFPFYSKKSFQYEREVRIISDVAESKITKWRFKINVDINQLIQTTIHWNQKTGIKT
jgi:hypothetical protein